MIPTNPKAIQAAQEQAARNVERGDWEDEFLPDDMVPKPEAKATEDLLKIVGKKHIPKS